MKSFSTSFTSSSSSSSVSSSPSLSGKDFRRALIWAQPRLSSLLHLEVTAQNQIKLESRGWSQIEVRWKSFLDMWLSVSGPDRGQSHVGWGDFPYVHTYIHPSLQPPLWAIQPSLKTRQSGLRPFQPGLRPSQPGLRHSQLGLRPSMLGQNPQYQDRIIIFCRYGQ